MTSAPPPRPGATTERTTIGPIDIVPAPRRRRRRVTVLVAASVVAVLAIGGITAAALSSGSGGSATTADSLTTAATATTATKATQAAAVKTAPTTARAATEGSAAAPGTALALLATLEVKGRAPKTGYTRDQFGPAWLDVDHNGCDTRNDILARDLTRITRSGTCKVMSGTLADPYTGAKIGFLRGQTTSALVQIDHVVPLSDAWQTGAQGLTATQRATFANDPLNLLAVDGSANEQKSDGDAATWLPKNKAFRCRYVARQVSVKAAYRLWVTPAEHDAISRILATCPAQPAVTADALAKAAAAAASSTPAKPAPVRATPPPAPAAGVVYANCTAVRAAGAAPLRAGQPGYSRKLDRDGDGVACE